LLTQLRLSILFRVHTLETLTEVHAAFSRAKGVSTQGAMVSRQQREREYERELAYSTNYFSCNTVSYTFFSFLNRFCVLSYYSYCLLSFVTPNFSVLTLLKTIKNHKTSQQELYRALVAHVKSHITGTSSSSSSPPSPPLAASNPSFKVALEALVQDLEGQVHQTRERCDTI
jgi:hypothetical protein